MVFCLEFVWLLVPVTEHHVGEPMGSDDLGKYCSLLLAEIRLLLAWCSVGSYKHDAGPSHSDYPSCPVMALFMLVCSPGCSERVTNQPLTNHRTGASCSALSIACADCWGVRGTVTLLLPCLKGVSELGAL